MAVVLAPQKKVLIYKSGLLPYSETFIREQALALTRWCAVLVGEHQVEEGLPLTGLDVALIGSQSVRVRKIDRALRHFLSYVPGSTLRRLRGLQADLVHVHFATEAVKAWPLLTRLKLPILITLHGQDINARKEWWQSGGGGRWMRRYPQTLLKIAGDPRVHFIAVSNAIKSRAIDFGIPEQSISVSYTGVDTTKFVPVSKPMACRSNVLFVGRLVEKKGCELLLRAFRAVQDSFPNVSLIVVGNGPLDAHLKEFAIRHGVRAYFVGSQDDAGVRRHLSEARVLCLPSVRAESGDAEGFGMVILEAQACGVPVITSAFGGAQEGISHEQSGIAHAEGDVEALERGLFRLLASDELCAQYGAEGRRRAVACFDIAECTHSLEQIYDRHSVNHGTYHIESRGH